MNSLSTYIIEKLKINKNVKVNSIFKSVDEIIDVFKIKGFGASDLIRRWIVDNKISEVIIYYDKSSDIIDYEYNTEKMIYDNNRVDEYLELLKTNNKDISNWKSSDNKEIKSNIQFNDFLIFMSRIHHSTRLPNVHFKINLTLLLHSMAFSTILEPQGFSVFSDSTCFPLFFIL